MKKIFFLVSYFLLLASLLFSSSASAAKLTMPLGSTSNIIRIKLFDASSASGAGLTGLTYSSSGLIIAVIDDVEATTTAYTATAGNIEGITTLGTYAAPDSGKVRFKEVDATNHAGIYELQIADARFNVTNARSMIISVSGASNLVQQDVEIQFAGSSGDPWSTALPGAYGAGTAGYIVGHNLDAAVSTRSTYAGGAVSSVTAPVTVGTNNDKTGYSLVSGPATTTQIADAVWDEMQSGHTTSGTFGYYLDSRVSTAGGGSLTAQQIWDYNISGYSTAGLAGTYLKGAGAAGDPWITPLPGAYGAGTAGAIVGAIPSGVTVIPSALSAGVLQQAITQTNNTPVTIIRGDAKTLTFNLGTGWPLTGKNVYFIAKTSPILSNSQAIVNRLCTVTDAVNGVATITLTTTETGAIGTYYAEVEVRNSDDTNPQTATQFILKIKQDVRQ